MTRVKRNDKSRQHENEEDKVAGQRESEVVTSCRRNETVGRIANICADAGGARRETKDGKMHSFWHRKRAVEN